MTETMIYKDKLIEISNKFILLKNYYLPFIGSKRVPFDKIKSVTVEKPSLLKGQFRIWGTGNFVTWFPLDLWRPSRDKIFIISLLGKTMRIGFTTENSETVIRIFEQKGLIQHTTAEPIALADSATPLAW
jgi:hypothetical protein